MIFLKRTKHYTGLPIHISFFHFVVPFTKLQTIMPTVDLLFIFRVVPSIDCEYIVIIWFAESTDIFTFECCYVFWHDLILLNRDCAIIRRLRVCNEAALSVAGFLRDLRVIHARVPILKFTDKLRWSSCFHVTLWSALSIFRPFYSFSSMIAWNTLTQNY